MCVWSGRRDGSARVEISAGGRRELLILMNGDSGRFEYIYIYAVLSRTYILRTYGIYLYVCVCTGER